ncbi:MAG: hypothetical protein QOJ29_866 [Thermoleophilaceae bacterium]|nr:hypothetical protein [Thermoleophilaceae bacterium]
MSSALAASTPEIKVLSNRADLISGGDALVEVVAPAGASAASLSVALNGSDVTSSFGVRADGRFVGLLTNLQMGDNVVTARTAGGESASLTILNHPIGGPVLAGPQIQPWTCFAGALDKQCNRPVIYAFSYKPTSGAPLQAYDPENPPSDVAMTTTDQGKTVPFIVRQETGTIDRDEYRIAVLFDPKKPWSPVAPQDGFNHKLVIFHGASCDTAYTQAAAPDVLNETALGKGFATMSHALDNAGHNCNIVTQAESLIMTKEHLVDTYGTVRYTIGSGCSGGSLVQQQVANAYPGLYQGITPQCSFTDAWSSAMQYEDYVMLRRYLENPAGWAPGVVWLPHQIQAIEGHINPVNAVTFTTAIPNSGDPSRSCPGVAADKVYDAQTNPGGVRCSLQDYMVNVFGRRAKDGFAQRPFDNVGIQYGLKALIAGTISPAQFLDLNAKIGSVDIDFNPTTARTEADRPALERVYRSGAVDQADNLDKVAIIDLRGPDPGAFHDVYRTYVMRARLDRNFHTHANQVLWRGLVPLLGDASYADEAILAVDKWLAAVEKDPRDLPLAQKVLADKPASVIDRCTNGGGVALPESVCDGLVTPYSDPRLESGMPMTDDTVKCELKPLLRADYGSVTFTDAEWAAMVKAFPSGVCDYTKPGVDRVATTPWQTYQDNDGSVVYGGRALGPAPVAAPLAPLSLTASTTCVSGRRLRLRLHVATGRPLRSARVYVNGRSRMVLKGRALTRTLSLRGLPGGAVRVKVVATTRVGKRLTARQVFRACAAKSRKR